MSLDYQNNLNILKINNETNIPITPHIQTYIDKFQLQDNFQFNIETLPIALSLFNVKEISIFNNKYYPTISFLTIDEDSDTYSILPIIFNQKDGSIYNPDNLSKALLSKKVYPITSLIQINLHDRMICTSNLRSSLDFSSYFHQVASNLFKFIDDNRNNQDLENILNNFIKVFNTISHSVTIFQDYGKLLPLFLYYNSNQKINDMYIENLLTYSKIDSFELHNFNHSKTLLAPHNQREQLTYFTRLLCDFEKIFSKPKNKNIYNLLDNFATLIDRIISLTSPFSLSNCLADKECNLFVFDYIQTTDTNHNSNDLNYYKDIAFVLDKIQSIIKSIYQNLNDDQIIVDKLNQSVFLCDQLYKLQNNKITLQYEDNVSDYYQLRDNNSILIKNKDIKRELCVHLNKSIYSQFIHYDFLQKYNKNINNDNHIELLHSKISTLSNINYSFDKFSNVLNISYMINNGTELEKISLDKFFIEQFNSLLKNLHKYSVSNIEPLHFDKIIPIEQFFKNTLSLSSYIKIKYYEENANKEIRKNILEFVLSSSVHKEIKVKNKI